MGIRKIKYADRDEWLSLRRRYIGGSDAGAVVGLNPYSSPFAVWAEKTGRTAGFDGNLTTEVGAYLEDLVAKLFTRETGKSVRRENRMLVNDRYPWACADVDRMVAGESALLEIKTTNSVPAMRKLRGGEYPEQWYCQMVHYLAVTGLERAYLAVLINCRELQIYPLDRDEEEIAALMEAERAFWRHVTEDIPPEIDGTEATAEAVKSIWPDSDGGAMNLMGMEMDLRERDWLVKVKKDTEAKIAQIDNRIKAEMREAERGVCDGWSVSWKSQSRQSFDRAAFTRENPKIDIDKYYKTTTGRVFRVTERKEGS